jgi:SAM-dependent methyltransferase
MGWQGEVVGCVRVELGRTLEQAPGRGVAVLVRGRGARRLLRAAFPAAVLLELPAPLPVTDAASPGLLAEGDERGGEGGARQTPEPAPRARVRLPVADGDLALAVVWLLGVRGTGGRRLLLEEIHRALCPGGELIVIDHNRPRRKSARLVNVVWCIVAGVHPWVRPAYPVAREIQAHGFDVISLRLACAERVQIVRARRAT